MAFLPECAQARSQGFLWQSSRVLTLNHASAIMTEQDEGQCSAPVDMPAKCRGFHRSQGQGCGQITFPLGF